MWQSQRWWSHCSPGYCWICYRNVNNFQQIHLINNNNNNNNKNNNNNNQSNNEFNKLFSSEEAVASSEQFAADLIWTISVKLSKFSWQLTRISGCNGVCIRRFSWMVWVRCSRQSVLHKRTSSYDGIMLRWWTMFSFRPFPSADYYGN